MNRCISLKGGASWSDFVGPYDALQKGQARLNQERCLGVVFSVHFAKVAAAASLARELMEQLAPVREVVGVLRNITRVGGMPQVRRLQPGMAGSRALVQPRSGQAGGAGRNTRQRCTFIPGRPPLQASFGVLRTVYPRLSGACSAGSADSTLVGGPSVPAGTATWKASGRPFPA